MENELNYLSEKIEGLDTNITDLQEHLDKGNGCGGRIGDDYRRQITEMTTEKTMLENILNHITINELS